MEAAVISALAALGGVALAQGFALLQARAARRDATRRLLAEKLEAVLEQVTRAEAFALALAESLESPAPMPPSPGAGEALPARRAYVLALLYFPPLADAARRHKEESERCGEALRAVRREGGAQHLPALMAALGELVHAREAFEAAAAEEARRIGLS